jgi:hypothetical protein
MAEARKYRFVIAFLLLVHISCSTKKGNVISHVSVDTMTGIKSVVETEEIGTGGGISGTGPAVSNMSIKRFDSSGKLIYKSYKTTNCDGCLCDISKWIVTAYNPDGSYNSLELDGSFVVIKNYNSSGELLSKNRVERSEFNEPDWIVGEEMIF